MSGAETAPALARAYASASSASAGGANRAAYDAINDAKSNDRAVRGARTRTRTRTCAAPIRFNGA